jgi:hypothetical protein
MTSSSDEDSMAPLVLVLVVVVFIVAWFNFLLPRHRRNCDVEAQAAGFAGGWVNGIGDCMVSVDGGRTWVQFRMPR